MTIDPDRGLGHFASRNRANGLPDSSAANILRVQGAEKQACSIANTSSRSPVVAGSIVTLSGVTSPLPSKACKTVVYSLRRGSESFRITRCRASTIFFATRCRRRSRTGIPCRASNCTSASVRCTYSGTRGDSSGNQPHSSRCRAASATLTAEGRCRSGATS